MKSLEIFTDGSCLRNPGGAGGYGIVFVYEGKKKEVSGGVESTTSNRMELLACIIALECIREKSRITLYSDSKYVVDSIEKKWAYGWRKNNWKKKDRKKAKNVDLWERLLLAIEKHEVKMLWIKSHNDHVENEICDQLAYSAANSSNLIKDTGYVEINDKIFFNSIENKFKQLSGSSRYFDKKLNIYK